jgi:hypothetical protein
MRLVKASEMQEMDRFTVEEMGIAGIVLMENAAAGPPGFLWSISSLPPIPEFSFYAAEGTTAATVT